MRHFETVLVTWACFDGKDILINYIMCWPVENFISLHMNKENKNKFVIELLDNDLNGLSLH